MLKNATIFGGVWIALGCLTAFAADADKAIKPEAVKLDRPVDFEKDIYPILDANCIACHNLAIKENNLNLEDVENILKGGKRGPSVIPMQPEKSPLYQLAARGIDPVMPPLPNKVEASALTPRELGLIRQWILEGAQAGEGAGRDLVQWQAIPEGMHAIYAVAMSPDGQYVACGRANQIFVYNIPTGTLVARLTDPNLVGQPSEGGKPLFGEFPAHRDFVHSLAFNEEGTMLASSGYRVVKLWQRPQNVQRFNLAAGAAVQSVAVSPDGKWLATGAADNSVKLWNLTDGTAAKTLAGHTGPVSTLQFSADSAKLYTGSADKTVRVWNVADGAAVIQYDTPDTVNALVVNPEGTQLITGGSDNVIRSWTIPAEGPLTAGVEMKGHSMPITSLALVTPPNGQLLSGSTDGTVRVWTVANGQAVRTMNQQGPVTAVAVSPDGKQFASAGANTVRLWNPANGQQVAEMKGDLRADRVVVDLTGDDAEAKALVTATANAVKAAETDSTAKIEAAKKAVEAKEAAEKAFTEAEAKTKEAQEKFDAAKKAADEKTDDAALAKAKTDAEKVLTDATAAQKKAEDAKTSAVKAAELAEKASKEAAELIVTNKAKSDAAIEHQKKVEMDLAAAKEAATATQKPILSLSYSPDSKQIAAAGEDNLIHTWSTTDGAPLEIFTGHKSPVVALAFTPDGGLVSGSQDQMATVWEVSPKWTLAGQLGPQPGAPLDVSGSPFVSRVLALDFSQDGKLLATGGGDPSRSGELMIWDVEKRALLRNIEDAHSDTVFGVEFSRDGKYLVSGAADKFVKLFEVETGKLVKSFEGHTHHVMDVSIKSDASIIVSAGADNAIKVWSVETGEQQRTIAGYNKQVTSIQFMGRGINFASCGGDTTVRFHRFDNGQNYRNFAGGTDYMYAVAATPDEKLIIAGGEDGVLRVWNGVNGQVVINFEAPKTAAQLEAEAQAQSATK